MQQVPSLFLQEVKVFPHFNTFTLYKNNYGQMRSVVIEGAKTISK